MSISHISSPGSGTLIGQTCTITQGAGTLAGDLIVAGFAYNRGVAPNAVPSDPIAPPAGWATLAELVSSSSATSSATRISVFARVVAVSGSLGYAFTSPGGIGVSACIANFFILRKSGDTAWQLGVTSGPDASEDMSWDVISGSLDTILADVVLAFTGTSGNNLTGFGSVTIAQSGATFSNLAAASAGQAGGYVGIAVSSHVVSVSGGAGAFTYHFAYTFDNVFGNTVFVRVREIAAPPLVPVPPAPCDCTQIVFVPLAEVASSPDPARDIYLDALTNNFALTPGGDLALVGGVPSIVQAIRQKLRAFLGEWFLDEEEGVAWFESILVKNPNLTAIRAIHRDAILAVPGVLDLTKLDLVVDASTRTLTVTFEATSDTGELVVDAVALTGVS